MIRATSRAVSIWQMTREMWESLRLWLSRDLRLIRTPWKLLSLMPSHPSPYSRRPKTSLESPKNTISTCNITNMNKKSLTTYSLQSTTLNNMKARISKQDTTDNQIWSHRRIQLRSTMPHWFIGGRVWNSPLASHIHKESPRIQGEFAVEERLEQAEWTRCPSI